MRKDGGGHHSQNYDTCIAQSALPLHKDIAHGAAVLHTEMIPLRMAFWTNSAMVRSPVVSYQYCRLRSCFLG
jgi:hypothetical protein